MKVRKIPELRLKSECREGDDRLAEKSTLRDRSVAQASEVPAGTMARLRRAARIQPYQQTYPRYLFIRPLTRHTHLAMEGAFGRCKAGLRLYLHTFWEKKHAHAS